MFECSRLGPDRVAGGTAKGTLLVWDLSNYNSEHPYVDTSQPPPSFSYARDRETAKTTKHTVQKIIPLHNRSLTASTERIVWYKPVAALACAQM